MFRLIEPSHSVSAYTVGCKIILTFKTSFILLAEVFNLCVCVCVCVCVYIYIYIYIYKAPVFKTNIKLFQYVFVNYFKLLDYVCMNVPVL
jgi:hypothetical protein